MSANTKIEWCDHSWSPWRGCTKVSAGCAHCYAETLSKRNPSVLGQWGKGKPRVLAKNWNDPVKWNAALHRPLCAECSSEKIATGVCCVDKLPRIRKTVFPSLCDWLDEEVPARWLFDFLALVLRKTPNLNWLLLTKRPELFEKRLRAAAAQCTVDPMDVTDLIYAWLEGTRIPLNVRIGASVEDQPNADWRIPELLKIPAVGRFLSLEPLLGPVRVWDEGYIPADEDGPERVGYMLGKDDGKSALSVTPAKAMKGIHWLIIGGESGHGARPCNVEWVRSLVKQGKAARVATFVKQLGANVSCLYCGSRSECVGAYEDQVVQNPACSDCCGHCCEDGHCVPLNHPKGGDPAEWPEDLRVREYPEGLR